MTRMAIQLYTLRDLDLALPELLWRVGETGLDGVEFAGVDANQTETIAAVLSETGLVPAAAHVPMESLEDEFEETVATYSSLDVGTLVVPYLDESHFENEEAVAATADRLTDLADRLSEHGFGLCYHNHDHEFVDFGDETAFDVLVEETDDRVGIELDVGWVQAAGFDPTDLLARLGERVPIVHLKDVDAASRTPVELGDGDLDVDACVAAARDASVEWVVYEHDKPDNPEQSLKHGAETLTALVK